MTQPELAREAGLSVPSIARIESSEKSPLRPANAMALFRAISRAIWPTDEQSADFAAATGLDRQITAFRSMPADTQAVLDEQARARTAHLWVDALLREMAGDQVLTALRNFAAAWDITLPGPAPSLDSVRYAKIQHRIDNHDVSVFTPLDRPIRDPGAPPSATPVSPPRRKSAT